MPYTRHSAKHADHSTRTHDENNAATTRPSPEAALARNPTPVYGSRGRPIRPSQARRRALRVHFEAFHHPALHPNSDTEEQNLCTPTIDVFPTYVRTPHLVRTVVWQLAPDTYMLPPAAETT